MIRFQHVYKEYPRTGLALQDVSLFVAKGEFVFLTGPSGAGKSSMLKLIYMEELPTQGDVWVSGMQRQGRASGRTSRSSAASSASSSRISVCSRTARPRQNVAFALEVIGAPRGHDPRQGDPRCSTQVGLASKATSYPARAERRRAAARRDRARARERSVRAHRRRADRAISMSARRAACFSSCATSTRRERRSSWRRTTSISCDARTIARSRSIAARSSSIRLTPRASRKRVERLA